MQKSVLVTALPALTAQSETGEMGQLSISVVPKRAEIFTEQDPERPHRSGSIQNGNVPVVLENQVRVDKYI